MYTQKEVANNYTLIAQNKTSAKWYQTLLLAVFAGAFIAVAGLTATIAGAAYEGIQATLVKAAVFPVGLILVVLTGSELFTGNNLLLAPVLSKDVKFTAMLKNLGIVYGGNLIGSALIAVIAVYCGAMNDGVYSAAIACAAAKCETAFYEALLRAIPCNILVCFAVWTAMTSKNAAGKVLAVYMPIFAFVVCGFEHSVANMYYMTAGLLALAKTGAAAASLTVGNALLYSLLPTTIGNMIGGMVCVALPLWLIHFRRSKREDATTSTEV